MASPSQNEAAEQAQDDPGESNDPRSMRTEYDAHIWQSLNDIFQTLGKLTNKIDQIGIDQEELKNSVVKHDKLIARVGFTIAGAIAVIAALWFIYDNFLKDRITFN